VGGLFSDPVGDLFAGIFGGRMSPPPPETVPLRILGLDALPSSRDEVRAAFRTRVMAAHPDLAAYTVPAIREVAEAAIARTPEVRELVWARDVLLHMVPTVTAKGGGGGHVARRHELPKCKGCDTELEHGAWRPRGGRWFGYCWACARDGENARRRELRAAARADRTCADCGDTFTPERSDGRFCSPAWRQRGVRRRRAERQPA
jgi:hypothetical protein